MLSILIPTYNYSIVALVNQIHSQAEKANIHFEIIVIDDFSSNKILLEENSEIIKLKNCQYLKNNENLGRTATRNLLAKTAIFQTLLFLDADVLPKSEYFIENFNLKNKKNVQVIYGGISYYNTKPEDHKILRWKYGTEREAISVSERLKHPYFIISQNLLIDKDIFIRTNSINTNAYGLDILFSNNLKKNKIQVEHIDNPVYHLGLESNQSFITKSLEAVKTTLELEKKNLLDNDLRPLQKSYRKLKKWYLLGFFNAIYNAFKIKIKSNLLSTNPSLLLFDIYRLHYYSQLKSEKNA